jgi:hypothetical protein
MLLLQADLKSLFKNKYFLMGYLPIFVALSGLILLYSLYTYNQIKPKKAALTMVIDQMAKLSSERKNLILTYDRANDNSILNEAAADLMKTSTDRFQSFRKENELITKTNASALNLSENEKNLKTQILDLNQRQEEKLKQLESKAGLYNRFIAKAPTKFVASIFGFKSF